MRKQECEARRQPRLFYTIDAKNTSYERNLHSSQLTLEPLRGAVRGEKCWNHLEIAPLEQNEIMRHNNDILGTTCGSKPTTLHG